MPWWARLKTSLPPFVSEPSIKMSWKRLSHSVVFHLVFELTLPASCHPFISFVPARPGQKGVWAQHELASAGYLQSPAICQCGTNQHFTRSPLRGNRLWRRQKGDVVWWRNRKHERGEKKREGETRETEIEAQSEEERGGRQLPRRSSQIYLGAQAPRRLQLLLCQKICALAEPRNMCTHTNAHVYMKSNKDRYSTFIFCILDKIYLRVDCQRKS